MQVYLTIRQRAWMRVTVDGTVEFDGRVTPGSAYPFVGGTQVEVLTGNGEAIQVFFNGQDYGVMGEFGQLVDQIYSAQGILAADRHRYPNAIAHLAGERYPSQDLDTGPRGSHRACIAMRFIFTGIESLDEPKIVPLDLFRMREKHG